MFRRDAGTLDDGRNPVALLRVKRPDPSLSFAAGDLVNLVNEHNAGVLNPPQRFFAYSIHVDEFLSFFLLSTSLASPTVSFLFLLFFERDSEHVLHVDAMSSRLMDP